MKMKKNAKYIILAVLLLILVLLIAIIGIRNREKTTVCSLKNNQISSGYSINSTYEIHSKRKIVSTIIINQKITSKDEKILKEFKDSFEKQYKNYNKTYGGYQYSGKINKDTFTSKVIVDYKKVDLDKFVKDNEAMKEYMNKKNKFTIDGAKKMYEYMGASCK